MPGDPLKYFRLEARELLDQSGEALLDPTTVPETIRAKGIELIGQYAIQIQWTDNHSAGIYNFRDLRANCPCPACAEARASGRPIGAYGTSVGCAALIHQFELEDKLDLLFDDTPFKQRLDGQGYDLPVYTADGVLTHNPALIVVLPV